MATNTTHHVFNSTQPGLSSVCSLIGTFAWQQQYLTPTTFIMFVFAAAVEALIFPIIILLNALVILAVKRKRYLRKRKSHVLLACLAATDLLVGAVLLPLVITSHVLRLLGVGPICLIDNIALETAYTGCGATFHHLVIISGERYIAIKHGLRYETLVTTRRLTTAVAVAWAVPVILTLVSVTLVLAGEAAFRDQLMNMAMLFIISGGLLAISFCQAALLLESRRHRKHIKAHQVSGTIAKELLKKDKAARTTTIVVGALFLCFAPTLVFFEVASNVQNIPRSLSFGIMNVMDVFVHSNSLINPIIYCVRTQEFRRAFRELLDFRGSQINAEFEMNKAGRSRGQRNDSDACINCTHTKKQTAWPDHTSSRGFRSCSLDLSKDSTHKQRTRRIDSVYKLS